MNKGFTIIELLVASLLLGMLVSICFRACKHAKELLSMPAFYTDVRCQGIPE